jgi:flagellum-specific peptidoglycan hydrolase FlgJ
VLAISPRRLLDGARAALPAGRRRPVRQMAVRMPASTQVPGLMPMAIPMDAGQPSRLAHVGALGFLALTVMTLWRQESVVELTRVALDGLRDHKVIVQEVDPADWPAMDPGLAWIVDPRSRSGPVLSQGRRSLVLPFEYEVKEGESLQDIAARFGTEVSAVLWNNGLDDAGQVTAGARLTILPTRGVLHLVKAGETLQEIAERYGGRVDDILAANGPGGPGLLAPGRVIVVAGGSVPIPLAITGHSVEVAATATPPAAAVPGTTDAAFSAMPSAAPPEEEDLPIPPGASPWQQEFILSVAPGARASQRANGVPASVTLAQAILESDWGRSQLTREANNLFGIKALVGPGTAGVYEIGTREVYSGRSVMVNAAFKAYTTLADSIADHGRWFHDNSRYHGALAVKDDPRAFARAIASAGYATDPGYAPSLIALMDRYDLYAYDVPADE